MWHIHFIMGFNVFYWMFHWPANINFYYAPSQRVYSVTLFGNSSYCTLSVGDSSSPLSKEAEVISSFTRHSRCEIYLTWLIWTNFRYFCQRPNTFRPTTIHHTAIFDSGVSKSEIRFFDKLQCLMLNCEKWEILFRRVAYNWIGMEIYFQVHLWTGESAKQLLNLNDISLININICWWTTRTRRALVSSFAFFSCHA